MYLIGSHGLSIFFMLLSMFWMGTWPNLFKWRAHEVRREPLFIIYAFTAFTVSVIAAFTLGSYGLTQPNFVHNLHSANAGRIASAFAGGVCIGLSNIFGVISNELSGIAIAMPINSGISIIGGTLLSYIIDPVSHPVFLALGIVFVVLALIFEALSIAQKQKYQARQLADNFNELDQSHVDQSNQSESDSSSIKIHLNDTKPQAKVDERPSGADMKKGIIIAIAAGIAGCFWSPLGTYSMQNKGHHGSLTAYTSYFFLSIGFLFVNVTFNLLSMYRPKGVGNRPRITITEAFNMKWYFFLIGIAAGFINALGNLTNFIAGQSSEGFAVSFAIARANTLVAGVYGVILWKELNNTNVLTKVLYLIGTLFYIGALIFLSSDCI